MDHVLLHELEELGTYGWIRDFGGDYTINLLRGSWLVLITNDEEYVGRSAGYAFGTLQRT